MRMSLPVRCVRNATVLTAQGCEDKGSGESFPIDLPLPAKSNFLATVDLCTPLEVANGCLFGKHASLDACQLGQTPRKPLQMVQFGGPIGVAARELVAGGLGSGLDNPGRQL